MPYFKINIKKIYTANPQVNNPSYSLFVQSLLQKVVWNKIQAIRYKESDMF